MPLSACSRSTSPMSIVPLPRPSRRRRPWPRLPPTICCARLAARHRRPVFTGLRSTQHSSKAPRGIGQVHLCPACIEFAARKKALEALSNEKPHPAASSRAGAVGRRAGRFVDHIRHRPRSRRLAEQAGALHRRLPARRADRHAVAHRLPRARADDWPAIRHRQQERASTRSPRMPSRRRSMPSCRSMRARISPASPYCGKCRTC